jgi:hypothetical protein
MLHMTNPGYPATIFVVGSDKQEIHNGMPVN